VNYEEIEKYVQNGLTEAERAAFEAELAADPELAGAVKLYQDIEANMKGSMAATAGEAALKKQLELLNQQYFGKKAGATVMEMQPDAHSGLGTGKAAATAVEAPVVAMRRRRMLYYFASAAAVLLVLLLIRPFGSGKFDADEVYAQNADYKAPPNWHNIIRGEAKDGNTLSKEDTLKAQVANLLEQKKYPEALEILEKMPVTDKNYDVMLAKGACYAETNDSARADQIYTAVTVQAGNSDAAYKANWRKALLYLKYKNIDACRASLENIPKDSDLGQKKVKALLKALPKP
jgi:hypothetical protein